MASAGSPFEAAPALASPRGRRRPRRRLARAAERVLPRVVERAAPRRPGAPERPSSTRSRSRPSASRSRSRMRAGWAGDMLDAKSENEKLRAENERLRQQLIQNQTAVRQNAELRRLLRFRDGPAFPRDYSGVAARIIGRTPGPVRAAGGHRRRLERPRARQRSGRDRRRARRPRDEGVAAQRARDAAHRRDERRLRARPADERRGDRPPRHRRRRARSSSTA